MVDLAVAPEYRRRGIATAVLNRCPGPLALRVARGNLPARRLYDRLGFTVREADALDLFLHRPQTGPAGHCRASATGPNRPGGSRRLGYEHW